MLKYKHTARVLIRYIEENNLNHGDKLPSLEELIENFQVSKNTIIKALGELERQGIIYQVRGSGIFVRGHKRHGYINLLEIHGFNSMLREFDIDSKVLSLELIKPTQEVMANLNIEKDQDVYHVKRLRSIEGRYFCIEESFLSKEHVPYLNEQIASESIFNYLVNNLSLQFGFLDHFLRARKLNAQDAQYLSLNEGDPAIVVESIFYLDNGSPFNFSKITYHFEEAQFFIQANSFYNLMNGE